LPSPSPCPGLPTRDDPATVKEPGFASQPIQLKLQAAEPDTRGHLKTAYARWSPAWHSIAVFFIQFFIYSRQYVNCVNALKYILLTYLLNKTILVIFEEKSERFSPNANFPAV
jgi:hypothetical protein